jgi:UDP-3-O-[3-hydroxymyristoyl] N-acetylglucosamine deacetylase
LMPGQAAKFKVVWTGNPGCTRMEFRLWRPGQMRKLTIGKEVFFRGAGIHSGKDVGLILKPSDSGDVVFRRTDLGGREIGLDPRKTETKNCSFLSSGDFGIRTVEHLLAALSASGIDSILAEMDGEEVPILDGSALPFAEAIKAAGIRPAGTEKKVFRITRPFRLEERGASVNVLPDPEFSVSYVIEFDHPAVGRQEAEIRITPEAFLREIAPARTFGFLKDVPELQRRGLALGGSYGSAVILDDEKVVNGPLRFPDEFVRHKILDLIGDLYLLGCPVAGRFEAFKAGHGLHVRTVNHLLDNPFLWTCES